MLAPLRLYLQDLIKDMNPVRGDENHVNSIKHVSNFFQK